MITSNDSSKSSEVRQKYQALFDKYNQKMEALQAAGKVEANDWCRVETLADYFGNLGTIKQVFLQDDDNYEPQFIRLPLDEEPFLIDADKRTIEVPAAFRNGISVEGDHGCEILYFKINRYFDGIDFNQMQIRIQCHNVSGEDIFYPESFRDVDSEPGYIIFGWIVDNQVTEKSGNIKFSVRIFKLADDEDKTVLYSFTTLAQSAVINPGMNFSFVPGNAPVLADLGSNWILEQIQNSTNTTGVAAEMPLLLYVNGESDLTKSQYEYDLDGSSKLIDVLGGTTDTGTISYKWSSANQQENLINQENGEIVWKETSDTSLVNGKKYYKAVGSDYVLDLTVDNTKLAAAQDTTNPNGEIYYEKHSTNSVNKAGEYSCIITNTLKAKPTSKTIKFIIPGPSQGGVISYPNSYADAIDNGVIHVIVPEGQTSVKLTASATLGNASDSVNYIWKSSPDNVQLGTGSELTLSNLSQNINSKYYAIVEETRNGDSILLKDADTGYLHTKYYRVTYAPQKPIVNITANPAQAGNSILKGSAVILSASKSNEIPSDDLKYQWYKAQGAVVGDADDIALEGQSSSTLSTNSLDVGRYYCIITNVLNGDSAKSEPSAIYTISE